MERILRTVLIVTAALAAACAPCERTLVLLSTNDMHAKIRNFPRLAAAVEACRDTAQLVVLVDAGDRWTGNAYVDRAATPGMPMIALMNRLGYDVATLGNHEFDHGQAFLGRMIDSMDFEVVCANVVSDTCSFPPLPPYTVLEEGGFRIGFVGVVTNYEGPGHPAGNASSFAGLTFPDPQQMALKYAAELRPKCDVLVLVSHMGDDRDRELLAGGASQYDVVIGGHTHEEVDTLIGGTLLTQTGKDLRNIGVTTIRMKGRKVAGVDFRLVPLAGYEPDPVFQKQVDACYANPELNRPMGEFGNAANKWGLANWMAGAVADGIDAEIGFYHIGGVRLDSMARGGVSTAEIYDLEPFGSTVCTVLMTPEQMRRLIMTKFNDPVNVDESHRIDLYSPTPYTILTDERGEAVDVLFPELAEGRVYKVSIGDYPYKNYADFLYDDGQDTGILITDLLLDYFRSHSPAAPDNVMRQQIRPRQ